MALHYEDPHWWHDPATNQFLFWRGGPIEEGADVVLPHPNVIGLPLAAARLLIPLLDESGLVVPRMDVQSRDPDLKIIHRLLDIVERP